MKAFGSSQPSAFVCMQPVSGDIFKSRWMAPLGNLLRRGIPEENRFSSLFSKCGNSGEGGEGVREGAILGVTERHLASQETRLATYV